MRLPKEVVVVVHRAAQVLVLYRAPEHDSYWHLVAGGVETGEDYRDAALRELREEIGLDTAELVDLGRRYLYPLAEEPHRRVDFPPGTEQIEVESFAVEVPAGWEPRLNSEHVDYRWLGVDEAVELLHWPEAHDVVRAVLSAA